MAKPKIIDEMTSVDFSLDCYAHIIDFSHLIKDQVCTTSYCEAISRNKHLFENKIILDVGSGLGLLSLFAARAGAVKVISVDCSNVVQYAKQIITDNHYDHIIEVVQGRMQDVELAIPPKTVDVIISSWMGYCLYHQSIIDAVIYARDKWLKPDGMIFPDIAELHIAAIKDPHGKDLNIEWWRNAYDCNMSCFRNPALKEPRLCRVKPKQVVSSSYVLQTIDLNTLKLKEAGFISSYMLEAPGTGAIDGIVAYFKVKFSKSNIKCGFDTSPKSRLTHWYQTVFYLDETIYFKNETFFGAVALRPANDNFDDIDIKIDILSASSMSFKGHLQYKMKRIS